MSTSAVPVAERWYRELIGAAVLIGGFGGLLALVFSGVTTTLIELVFGSPTSEPFSGSWWWILFVSAGALVVAFLRARLRVAKEVPGAVAFFKRGWVDPRSAAQLVVISAVSLVAGASLGPAFGVVVGGGAFGAWIVSRRPQAEDSERHLYALTGMSAGVGAAFSAPLFGAVLASELSPTPTRHYVTAFIPQYIAATIGYLIFFGATGAVMLGAFELPGYVFEWWHLAASVGLGLLATVLLVAYVLIGKAVAWAGRRLANPYVQALILGALVGAIAFMLPLTATGGTHQLTFETEQAGTLAAGLLLAVLLAKMFAVHLSLAAGFLGGTVFPMLFMGGTAGLFVHELLPEVPIALAVAGMMAALPGTIIGAPVSFVLIGVVGVGIGVESLAPIGIAVITAHVVTGALQVRLDRRDH